MDIIKHLDELRAKATQGEWPSDYINDPFISESVKNDAAYSIALHNSYESLRQAVLDGERYKVAGEALAKAVDNLFNPICKSLCGCENGLAGHDGPCFMRGKTNGELLEDSQEALSAYRTAIDDSSK